MSHSLLGIHSVPTIPEKYAGWWTPSGADLDQIRVLTHVTKYVSPSWCMCATNEIKAEHFRATGSGPSHLLNHWYHFGEHYVYTWLTEWPPPRTTDTLPSPHLSQYEDEDGDHSPVVGNHLDELMALTSELNSPFLLVLEIDAVMGDATGKSMTGTPTGTNEEQLGYDGFASVHD